MKYSISYKNPLSSFIDIQLLLREVASETIYVQLPAWRPGRYELGNFAKNIRRFEVFDGDGNILKFQKVTKDRWKIFTNGSDVVDIRYEYFAAQMDAGSTYLDEEQLYINFVNCLLYMEGRLEVPCEIELHVPPDYTIACGLESAGNNVLKAIDYYHLVDAPMVASAGLQKLQYQVGEKDFFIWLMGKHMLDTPKLIQDFEAFTAQQLRVMGDFPFEQYHFLIQLLPYKHYHGVEHHNSTVITLGPWEKMHAREGYQNLMGICSHELFHAWNVIKIRPEEMMPYDFTGENYFKTGFVAEGFTTYFGDLFLVRSGFFKPSEYVEELNKLLKKHFENFGRFNLSIADSSYDLWLDGYSAGIPDRKVSIYIKGAIVAMILDLEIRRATKNSASLDTLIRTLWETYGKPSRGYALDDIRLEAEKIAGISFKGYFDDFIYGTLAVEEKLSELLGFIGLQLTRSDSSKYHETWFGFKLTEKEGKSIVAALAPGALAAAGLAKDDEIVAINHRRVESNVEELIKEKPVVEMMVFRKNLLHHVQLTKGEARFYPQWRVIPKDEMQPDEIANFISWLHVVQPEKASEVDKNK